MSKRITPILLRVLLIVLLLPVLAFADRPITGQVLASIDQTPVAGATVIIKGSKVGTSTGLDGKFTIHANQGDVLVITGVGITRQEITVGAEDDYPIKVVTSSRNLNEVVVTATGIKKSPKESVILFKPLTPQS